MTEKLKFGVSTDTRRAKDIAYNIAFLKQPSFNDEKFMHYWKEFIKYEHKGTPQEIAQEFLRYMEKCDNEQ